jgi:hypothetical protein
MDYEINQTQHEFHTTDIYLSAYLIAGKFAALSRIESSGARRKVFVLSPRPNQDTIQSFYSKEESSKIIALEVLSELRNLKGMIMSGSTFNNGGGYAE